MTNECLGKSSLQFYNKCFIAQGCQPYLKDKSFKRARLKLLARINALPLSETLHRINMLGSSSCKLCDCNLVESLNHFLLECTYYNQDRNRILSNLKELLISCGGHTVYDLFVDLPTDEKILLLLGDTGVLIDSETQNIFDKIGKDMLTRFWEVRQDISEI